MAKAKPKKSPVRKFEFVVDEALISRVAALESGNLRARLDRIEKVAQPIFMKDIGALTRMHHETVMPAIAELKKAMPDLAVRAHQADSHGAKIKALEEAICPRVAARLTALEKGGATPGKFEFERSVNDRLTALERAMSKDVARINALKYADRLEALEKLPGFRWQDMQAMNNRLVDVERKVAGGHLTAAETAAQLRGEAPAQPAYGATFGPLRQQQWVRLLKAAEAYDGGRAPWSVVYAAVQALKRPL